MDPKALLPLVLVALVGLCRTQREPGAAASGSKLAPSSSQGPGKPERSSFEAVSLADSVPPGAIEGLVVDENGQPVEGAQIELVERRSWTDFAWIHEAIDEPRRPVSTAVTRSAGVFRFELLDPHEDWTLVVTHEHYRREEVSVEVPEGAAWREKLILRPARSSTGVVRDARNGRPVAGATLVIDNPWDVGKSASPRRIEAVTDAEGAYSFANVSSGPQVLTISAPGYATQEHPNFSSVTWAEPGARSTSKQQDFELRPGKPVAGRVVGADGEALSNVEVEARRADATRSATHRRGASSWVPRAVAATTPSM